MRHQRQLRLGFDGGTERNEAGARRSDVIHHYAPTKGRLGPKKKIEKQRGDGGNRTETGSAFTECPLCGRKVALSTAERHVEECLARGGQNPKPPRSTRRDETEAKVDLGPLIPHEGELSGQYTWLNFISVEEEADLVAYLDAGRRQEWIPKTFNGLAFHKNWGLEVDLRGRTINPARHPMPPILTRLCERMRERGGGVLGTFRPDEANAIDYRKSLGHSLTPHFDDRQLNGDVLCNLCLVSDCAMTYTYGKKGEAMSVDVELPRRSLQVQTGSVRYDWKHGISNQNLRGERRISITFRECRQDGTKEEGELGRRRWFVAADGGQSHESGAM